MTLQLTVDQQAEHKVGRVSARVVVKVEICALVPVLVKLVSHPSPVQKACWQPRSAHTPQQQR